MGAAVFFALLVSACLGLGYTGYNPTAVASANKRDTAWALRCANGPSGVAPVKGKCPLGGYPSGFTAAPDGSLVMALS